MLPLNYKFTVNFVIRSNSVRKYYFEKPCKRFTPLILKRDMKNSGVLTRILDYYFAPENRPLFGEALDRASKEFFGEVVESMSEDATGHFTEWFLFDFTFEDGRTPFQYFYDENPLQLSPEERETYRAMRDNEYGIFEVKEVRRDEGLTLSNIQTGKTYEVEEVAATRELESGHTIIGRVVCMGERYEIAGGSTVHIALPVQKVKDAFLLGGGMKLDPKIVYEAMQYKDAAAANHTNTPAITDLDLSHAGVEMTPLEDGEVDLKISYEGPSDESYDGCPVCQVLVAAREKGEVPDPETIRHAIDQMMREKRDSR